MVDFRKIPVLAGLALLLGLSTIASAQQPLVCTASAAVPPTLRSEGLTELTGDIVLDCTGGTPTPACTTGITAACTVPQANFTIFTSAPVTSRVTSATLPSASEALLLVDEPGSASNNNPQLVCASGTAGCSLTGATAFFAPQGTNAPVPNTYNGSPAVALAGTTQTIPARSNMYVGLVASANQVQFLGVPVDPPGTTGHRIFRFTNIRVNASAVSAGAGGLPGSVQALIGISGSSSLPINNPTQIVGFVQSGMTFSVGTLSDPTTFTLSDISFAQCNSRSTSAPGIFQVRFTENFPTAFKVRGPVVAGTFQNSPGSIYNTESGFFGPATAPGIAGVGPTGQADAGTRLKAVFANIPAGVSVYVGTNQGPGTTTGSTGAEVLNASGAAIFTTPTTSGLTCPAGSSTLCGSSTSPAFFQLPVTNGTAQAVWEVTATNPLANETFRFPVFFVFTANASQNSPPPGTASVTGGFAPTPTDLGISLTTAATPQSTGIPRFVEGTQRSNIFTIFVCRTNLLFPFVTNQGGFDTGLAISNTSTDPFGTAAQAGTCTLNWFGASAPAPFPTANIVSGTTYTTLASSTAPGFQGYMIATCQFQYAHGFAFVSDFGARNLAMGYLALVIPEPGSGTRAPSDLSKSQPGAGEQLGY